MKLSYAMVFPVVMILLMAPPTLGEDEDSHQLCADQHVIEAMESIEDAEERGSSPEHIRLLTERLNEAIVLYESPTKGISCFRSDESLQLIQYAKYVKLVADDISTQPNYFAEDERLFLLLVASGVVGGALLTTFSVEAILQFRRNTTNRRSPG